MWRTGLRYLTVFGLVSLGLMFHFVKNHKFKGVFHVNSHNSDLKTALLFNSMNINRTINVNNTSNSALALQLKQNRDSGINDSRLVEADVRNKLTVQDFINFKTLFAVPNVSKADIIPIVPDNISKLFLELPAIPYTYNIAILTPIRDVSERLEGFKQEIQRLTYPSQLCSLYFGEDSSQDTTFSTAKSITETLKTMGFKDSDVFHFNVTGGVDGNWSEKHRQFKQKQRRSHMAMIRNLLVKEVLRRQDFDYILWIDSDIKTLPADLIQQLLFAKSDVAVASCTFMDKKTMRNYDKNSWRETPISLDYETKLEKEFLIVEGYKQTRRILLPDLKGEGRVVPLDGVGACSLLVKADCFKSGLMFPESVYEHHIESEGLAKLAKRMGYTVVGLPYVEVMHS